MSTSSIPIKLYNWYKYTPIVVFPASYVIIFMIMIVLKIFSDERFYWAVGKLFEIEAYIIKENDGGVENAAATTQPTTNEYDESGDEKSKIKFIIDFYGKKIWLRKQWLSLFSFILMIMVMSTLSAIGLVFAYECILPESTEPKDGPCALNGVTDCFGFSRGESAPTSYFQCEPGEEVNATINGTVLCYRWMWKNLTTLRFIEQVGMCAAILQAFQGFLKLYFSINFFVFKRRKGVASGMLLMLNSIAGPNPSLIKQRDDLRMFKRPVWLCLFIIAGCSFILTPVILLAIQDTGLISVSFLSYALLGFLVITMTFALPLGFIADLNDTFTFFQIDGDRSTMGVLRISNKKAEKDQVENSPSSTSSLRSRSTNKITPLHEEEMVRVQRKK
jgi:hypothetical protein